jgi:hypothetical protein
MTNSLKKLKELENRRGIFMVIIGILTVVVTVDSFLGPYLAENQVQATATLDNESNTGSTLPEPSQPPPPVRIVSQNAWADDSNMYAGRTFHIVGEVMNESSEILDMVKVVATLYDMNNQVVGTDSTYLEINNNFYPGEKSPFKITISNDDAPIHQLSSYTLDWR